MPVPPSAGGWTVPGSHGAAGQETNAVSTNEKYPHVQSGPEHLEHGLMLAATAEERLLSPDAEGDPNVLATVQAFLAVAQVHIHAAHTLAWATMPATEGEELGEDWAELLDPDGRKRLSVERNRAHTSAVFENEARNREAKAREHEARMEELRAETPIDLYPANPYAGPLVPSYGESFAGPDREELVSDGVSERDS